MPELLTAPLQESVLSRADPFPGLRPYGEEDATWFFGRSREINDLLKRLRRLHFVAIVGASGSGKSSVVRAGVLPQIRDGYLDAEWRIAQFRPGERPMANLAEALGTELQVDPKALTEQLLRGPMGLVRGLQAAELPRGSRVLILVDQFEELFQFAQRTGDSAQEEIKEFLKLLLTASSSDDVAVYVLVTMRLEWLSECSTYAGLAEAINEGLYLVPQMRRQQFQQAILGPLEAAAGSLTSALLGRMLNDLDNKSDQLPVLQHALLRLWDRDGAREPFDTAGYEAVGTFSNCLSAHAEEVYAELTERQKQVAELLFRGITQVNKGRKMRRPRPVGDLLESTRSTFAELAAVITAFSKPGRSFLVTTQGALSETSIVDLSHEALIRQWNRLSNWVEHEAEVQNRLERLEEDATEWDRDRAGQKSCLYTGSRLVRTEELSLSGVSATATVFLKESVRARFWQLFWRRGWMVIGVLLLAGVATVVALERAKTARAVGESQAARLKQAESEANAANLQAKKAQEFQANLVQQIGAAQGDTTALAAIVQTIQAKRVYLQYPADQAQMAQNVQRQLQKRNFNVPGLEQVASSATAGQTVVRFYHNEDRADALSLVGFLKTQLASNDVVAKAADNFKGVVPSGQFQVVLAEPPPVVAGLVAVKPPPVNPNPEPVPMTPLRTDAAIVVQGPTLHTGSFPNPVVQGRSTTLTWSTEHTSELQIEGLGKQPLEGSIQVTPEQTTTYKFIATGDRGTVSTLSEKVTVLPPAVGAAPPAAVASSEAGAVKAALGRYQEAYQSESLDDMMKAWPSIPKNQQKNLKNAFLMFNAIRLTLNCNDEDIHLQGDAANALCRQSAVYTIKGEKQPEQKSTATFRLRKAGGGWVVDGVQ